MAACSFYTPFQLDLLPFFGEGMVFIFYLYKGYFITFLLTGTYNMASNQYIVRLYILSLYLIFMYSTYMCNLFMLT